MKKILFKFIFSIINKTDSTKLYILYNYRIIFGGGSVTGIPIYKGNNPITTTTSGVYPLYRPRETVTTI